jgi:hypothetical protein
MLSGAGYVCAYLLLSRLKDDSGKRKPLLINRIRVSTGPRSQSPIVNIIAVCAVV